MKSEMIVNKIEDEYVMDAQYYSNVKYEVPFEYYRLGYEITTKDRINEQETLLYVLKSNSFPIYMHVLIDGILSEEIDQVTYTTQKIKNSYREINYYIVMISNEHQLKKCSELAYYLAYNDIAEVFFSGDKEDSILVKNDEYILKSSFTKNSSFIVWITHDATALHYISNNNRKWERIMLTE